MPGSGAKAWPTIPAPDTRGLFNRAAARLSTAMAVRNIVILTGAGISAESGVPTFRGPDGLWEGHRVEDVATPQAFRRNPVLVQRFYDARRAALAAVRPNAAHRALARLDAEWTGDFLIVTQNVDDLHERGGAQRLLHMHGELQRARRAARRRHGRLRFRANHRVRAAANPGCDQTSSGSAKCRITWTSSKRPSPQPICSSPSARRVRSIRLQGLSALPLPPVPTRWRSTLIDRQEHHCSMKPAMVRRERWCRRWSTRC